MGVDVIRVTSPWDGTVVDEQPLDDAAAVDRKAVAAQEAAARWRRTPMEARLALVERFCTVALAERETLAATVSRQMGKPISEARGEVGTLVQRARMAAAIAPEALRDEGVPLGDGIRRTLVREPLGVVLAIAAWNYPLLIAVNVVVPALLAGNSVLLKHASQTPGVGQWFEDAFRRAGAPEGLVTAVHVRGRDAKALVQHPAVSGVSFTGSVGAGRTVYEQVASRSHGFIDCGLELGGKDPAYVRPDADLAWTAANLVEGAFYNAGQSCCGIERVYVHQDVWRPFSEAYVEAARAWVVDDPMKDGTVMGPVAAASTLDLLEAQVAEAKALGGEVALGGTRHDGPGWRFPASVVLGADQGSRLMREESFGPVIGLRPVADDAEAVARMNDTDFGLTASIWTADTDAGEALARETLAGTVYVNRCDYVDPALGWTGFRDTGKGVTMGKAGFHQLTRVRGIHARPLSLVR